MKQIIKIDFYWIVTKCFDLKSTCNLSGFVVVDFIRTKCHLKYIEFKHIIEWTNSILSILAYRIYFLGPCVHHRFWPADLIDAGHSPKVDGCRVVELLIQVVHFVGLVDWKQYVFAESLLHGQLKELRISYALYEPVLLAYLSRFFWRNSS